MKTLLALLLLIPSFLFGKDGDVYFCSSDQGGIIEYDYNNKIFSENKYSTTKFKFKRDGDYLIFKNPNIEYFNDLILKINDDLIYDNVFNASQILPGGSIGNIFTYYYGAFFYTENAPLENRIITFAGTCSIF